MCLQSRAQFHQLVGRYDTAIRDFTEVLDVAEVVYGAHHLQVCVFGVDCRHICIGTHIMAVRRKQK